MTASLTKPGNYSVSTVIKAASGQPYTPVLEAGFGHRPGNQFGPQAVRRPGRSAGLENPRAQGQVQPVPAGVQPFRRACSSMGSCSTSTGSPYYSRFPETGQGDPGRPDPLLLSPPDRNRCPDQAGGHVMSLRARNSRRNPVVEKRGATVPVLLSVLVLAAGPGHACIRPRTSSRRFPRTSGARLDAERVGHHDANNMRTVFWNYGMVGDYPARSRQRGSQRLPLGRGAQGQRHELQRRRHALRPGQDHPDQRRGRLHHGNGVPRAAGHQPLLQPGHAFRAPAGLFPGRSRPSIRAGPRPSATTRGPGPISGPTGWTTSTDPGLVRFLERLFRQADRGRPGKLHGHGR